MVRVGSKACNRSWRNLCRWSPIMGCHLRRLAALLLLLAPRIGDKRRPGAITRSRRHLGTLRIRRNLCRRRRLRNSSSTYSSRTQWWIRVILIFSVGRTREKRFGSCVMLFFFHSVLSRRGLSMLLYLISSSLLDLLFMRFDTTPVRARINSNNL